MAKANAAAAAIMERRAFAIDEVGTEEDIDDTDLGGEEDDKMMEEVDAFLEAHGTGV